MADNNVVRAKIGILAHYGSMKSDFMYLNELMGYELLFSIGVLESAVDVAVEMEQMDKVGAIIAFARTIMCIQPYITVPVVALPRSPYSLAKAFHEAKKIGKKIAFVDTSNNSLHYDKSDYNDISMITGCKVKRYIMENSSQADEILQEINTDECSVVVSTAGCVIAKSRKYGLKSVQVKVSEQDMVYALNIAANMAMIKESETRKAGYMRSVINASLDGTFTLAQNGKINIVNQQAEHMLGMNQNELINRNLEELAVQSPLFRQLLDMNDDMDMVKSGQTSLVVSRSKIMAADKRQIGIIYHLREMHAVQEQEMLIRKKAREKGFVAAATFEDICGRSPAILSVIEQAKKYAATSSNILINGESGSGKELFAQSIHNRSYYRSGPFLAVNCSTLPEALLESELFGYEEGAFTGASKGGKVGLLEMAHRGTLFLDEIGEMPIQLQAKLLRVLQERCLRRIGGERNIFIDLRIISATNRDLSDEIIKGKFRSDLYYRINVLNIHIPPLRERDGDIAILANQFAESLATQTRRPFKLSPACYKEMERYNWPGNVRELSNFIERLVVLADKNTMDANLVRQALGNTTANEAKLSEEEGDTLHIPVGTMKEMELEILRQMYTRFNGDSKKLEFATDISHTTLWRRLKEIR